MDMKTANAISGAREYYLESGFDEYLTKPVESSKLEETMCRFLPVEKVHPVSENSVSENKNVVVLAFRHSVLVKDLERKLARMGYKVSTYEKNLKNITENSAGTVGFFVLQVFDDTVNETDKEKLFRSVCKLLSEKNQKTVIIGKEKNLETLKLAVSNAEKFAWINSPLESDELKNI